MTFNRAAAGRKVLIAEQKTDVAGLRHIRLHSDVQRNKWIAAPAELCTPFIDLKRADAGVSMPGAAPHEPA
ncbi:hypothetical protein [Herbaspirillum camelliae]|uniref:hypothetical protein n=1 Tax=Herbaspirillum camelliae TaxID=1892903 RepID=UPI000AD152A3|nr:hypothetical protein [Herbaspirillum camelliae]